MAWEKVEERLKNALTVTVSFPAGTIWLPDRHLSIDDWLTSIAETDEELRELNIPRIRFLQNRWRIEPLMELEWDEAFSNQKTILAMYIGERAYILFFDWNEYQVIAGLEPKSRPSLYRAVVSKLLANRSFVRRRPTHVKNRRPDLLPDLVISSAYADAENFHESLPLMRPEAAAAVPGSAGSKPERWKGFLSDVLVGWIGKWLNIPEIGFWHEEVPESIGSTTDRKILLRYEPSNGDKQRDAQKRKKQEAQATHPG